MEQTNSFQVRLFQQLNEQKNIFISPVSIYQALSLTANGAKGETQTNIIRTLETDSNFNIEKLNTHAKEIYSLMTTKGTSCKIANAILTKDEILKEFKLTAKTDYGAKVDTLLNVEQVNKWCSLKTEGKINNLITKLDEDTRMIILNAIYFSGQWITKFNNIENGDFYLRNGTSVKAEYMKARLQGIAYSQTTSEEVIGLGLKNTDIKFYIILPQGDIDDYLNSLSDSKFKNINSTENIELTMPKFKIEYQSSLKTVLQGLGMNKAFTGEADFSGLTKGSDLHISDVIHKTYIKVDENGLEAAAVTAVIMSRACVMEKIVYKEITIDKPFIVAIKHPKSKDLLFLGKIENVLG
jgi:serpin B